MSLVFWIYICLFAVLGTTSRVAINMTLSEAFVPWGTLAINVLGSFLIGVIYSKNVDMNLKLALMMGLLGSFTTFSGFSLDVLKWLSAGQIKVAAVYFFLTNFACLGSCFLGIKYT